MARGAPEGGAVDGSRSGTGAGQQPAVQRWVYRMAFGVIEVEVDDGVVYVNGDGVEPIAIPGELKPVLVAR